MLPKYSFIIPVYNRPEELRELLDSMTHLRGKDNVEVLVVEDGSSRDAQKVVEEYASTLTIKYLYQDNTGPGGARNRGALEAQAPFLVFLDSDTLLPPDYLIHTNEARKKEEVDLWGGPDRAHEDFSLIQKAINYSMTSFFTTGGIRGSKRRLDKFYPRSFNMGISKTAFEALGGFGEMRFGEDLDLSMRAIEKGYRTACYHEAWVYHKRRVSWRQFFKQVYNSGIARIDLALRHTGSLRLVHFLPSLFVVAHLVLLPLLFVWEWLYVFPLTYALLIVVDVFLREGHMNLAFYSVVATYVQLFGYGLGFLNAIWKRLVLRKGPFSRFEKTFYN